MCLSNLIPHELILHTFADMTLRTVVTISKLWMSRQLCFFGDWDICFLCDKPPTTNMRLIFQCSPLSYVHFISFHQIPKFLLFWPPIVVSFYVGLADTLDPGSSSQRSSLTHSGRVPHICVSKRTIIGLDDGWSPGRRQTIIWTNAGILSIGPLGINLNRNLYIFIQENVFENVVRKLAAILSRPQCLNTRWAQRRW